MTPDGRMNVGQFIVFEGIDGAGTSTQTALLGEALCEQDHAVHLTREPSDGPVGVLIRLILTRRLVVPGCRGPCFPCMETMALLFAADRIDHLESEMVPNLNDGVTVVSDRYVYSSIAYQTLTARTGDDSAMAWITSVNSRARWPDLVLVIDVPADVAAVRRGQRGGADEMYEVDALQCRLRESYLSLPERYPEQSIEVIDGSQSVESVQQAVLERVMQHFQENEGVPANG